MAFPTLAESFTWSDSVTTTFTIPLTGFAELNSGELVMVWVGLYNGNFSTSTTAAEAAGWTVLVNRNPSTTHRGIILYKESDGTETGVEIGMGATGGRNVCAVAMRVQGWNTVEVAGNGNTVTTTPNPPSLTPTWGADDTLWLAGAIFSDDNGTVTGFPTNYTEVGTVGQGGTNNSASVTVASRQLNAATEDPGAFTIDESERWYGQTVAVEPGSKGASSGTTGTVTQAVETDTALSITPVVAQSVAFSQATESSSALPVTPGAVAAPQSVTVNQSTETDTAQTITPLGVETTGSSDDFDSALGTIGTITDPYGQTPTVPLVPYDPGEVSGWLNIYVRVSGVDTKTPTFTLDFTDFRETQAPDDPDWQMVWRYVDDTDPGTGRIRAWNAFDNGSGGNNSGDSYVHTFYNNSAFTSDDIEIAIKPRFRYLDTQHAIAYAAASSYGAQLPSCNSSHYHDQITITSGANSAAGTTLNLYGILLDDTTSQPAGGADKLNIVLIPGQHSSEDQGNLLAWEIVKRYIDGGASDDWFRQHCRLFVYDANPAGRYYGKERYTEESAGDEDPNRAWDDTGSEQINAVKAAIVTDLASYGNRMDVMYDCHGAYSLNGNSRPAEFGIYDDNSTAAANFKSREAAAMVAAEGNDAQGATYIIRFGDNPVGSAGHYASSVWSAQLPLTPENPIAAEGFPDAGAMYYDRRAAWFRTALENMVANSELTLTVDGSVTVDQAAETDTAQPMTPTAGAVTVSIGQATDASTALPIVISNNLTVTASQASETDTAQPITPSAGATTISIGQAVETNSALPASPSFGSVTVRMAQAQETSTAQTVTPSIGATTISIGQAVETDSALPMVYPLTASVTQAVEADSARRVYVRSTGWSDIPSPSGIWTDVS